MAKNKFQNEKTMARCVPMSSLQAVLSGKWKILILWYVSFYKVERFGSLMRRLDGITQSTLTKQLRELEQDGFLHRTVYPAPLSARLCESVQRAGKSLAFRKDFGYFDNNIAEKGLDFLR